VLAADTSPPPRGPDAALTRGETIGRFVVLGLIGRGAMGEVYGAYDPELDRKIAIKLVRADRSGDSIESRARLMREAQATAKISHPNVVIVHDAGTVRDRVFVAMEFVEGHTLTHWLLAQDRRWPEILEIFFSAGRGLAAAHDKGLVHRDFKPDNVMVALGGQVRVMDFGLARLATAGDVAPAGPSPGHASPSRREVVDQVGDTEALDATRNLAPNGDRPPAEAAASPFDDSLTQTGAVLGTPAYMSPEQFDGRPADARSDQFSFCVALFEAVYGERPFKGRNFAELAANVLGGRLAEPSATRHAPAWVRTTLERGLRTDPAERFPSMAALLKELDRRPRAGSTGFADGAAAKLAGVWEAPLDGRAVETEAKAAIRAAFMATGKSFAADAFSGASAILDAYAARWSQLYIDVLEATHVRGEQSAEVLDLRMAYLFEGLDDLKALCRLFRTAGSEVVENAISAATSLGTLERCQQVELLRAVLRPPNDGPMRAAVDQLRPRLVELRALFRVGRLSAGLELAAPLVEEARAVGYGPLLAEALLVRGMLLYEGGWADAALLVLEDAVWTAELARHDEVAAQAATYMIMLAGYSQDRFDVADVWCRHCETLLSRMGGHDQLWGWYFNNRAGTMERRGRLADAIEDDRRAIAAKERVLGPDAPDVGVSLGNLALRLFASGDFAGGLAASARAVEIVAQGLGKEHPAAAIPVSNHSEALCRVGRFEEARPMAAQALAIFERETDPNGLRVTYPLYALGLSELGVGHPAEALVALERAVKIRDAQEQSPARLAEVHFALGRALHDSGGSRERARKLVARACEEYASAAKTPVEARDFADAQQWLTEHPDPG
jgi:tetratricopeptide (TPR) repeat protein